MTARRAGRIERSVKDQLREAGLFGTGIKTPALGVQALVLAAAMDMPNPVTIQVDCPSCGEEHTVDTPAPHSRDLTLLARELRMTMGAVLKEDTGGDGVDGVSGGPE